MENITEINRNYYTTINAPAQNAQSAQGAKSFSNVLNSAIGIQFSKHAAMRLTSRDINLTGEQIERVRDGVQKAGAKGVKDCLALVDNVALVVNVKSGTVITAAERKNADIFTNIDGAVIV